MMAKMCKLTSSTRPLRLAAHRYGIDYRELAFIVLDYIENNNAHLYYIRMEKLCGRDDVFIKQLINKFITDAKLVYETLSNVESIEITGLSLGITYVD